MGEPDCIKAGHDVMSHGCSLVRHLVGKARCLSSLFALLAILGS